MCQLKRYGTAVLVLLKTGVILSLKWYTPIKKRVGGLMPSYHSPRIDGVKVCVRPLGFRRIFRFYPYSQGNKVRFRLEVKDKSRNNPLGRIAVYEDLLLPKGSKKERYPLLTAPDLQALGEEISTHLDIEGSVIIDAGRQRYTINHPLDANVIEIITFDAKKDATMFMWLTPTIIALLGTIISVILWVFMRG